jgi:predicted O-methyltransferase YrrM
MEQEMSSETLFLSDALYAYMKAVSLREPHVLSRLREETSYDPMHTMQISPEQGQFMSLLVKLIGAERAIDVGVYTGYSSLCVAMAMAEKGKMVACDVSERWASVARRYWEEAGVASKIQLHLAPAIQTLDRLLNTQGECGAYDFVFIDADKENSDGYYERCLELLRPGGLMAIDNVFWGGDVADPEVSDKETTAIRALNVKIRADARVDMSMMPIGDGLMLVRKR